MLLWAALVITFLLVITYVVELSPLMRVTMLSGTDWLWVIGVPFVTIFWHEIKKAVSH